jgi:hypothetical protein
MMARLILTLQTIGVVVLLLCAVGDVLLGDLGNAAVAMCAVVLLMMR